MGNNSNDDQLSNNQLNANKINDDKIRDDRLSKLRVDISLFKTVDAFHDFIKEILSLSPHYGKNLDALWDELSVRKAPVRLIFYNCNQVDETLSTYLPKLEALFEELHLDNDGIEAEFIDDLVI